MTIEAVFTALRHPGVILGLLLQLADVATTIRALKRPGRREANPVVAALMSRLGRGWVPVKLALGWAGTLTVGIGWPPAVWVLVVLMSAVVVHNISKGN